MSIDRLAHSNRNDPATMQRKQECDNNGTELMRTGTLAHSARRAIQKCRFIGHDLSIADHFECSVGCEPVCPASMTPIELPNLAKDLPSSPRPWHIRGQRQSLGVTAMQACL